MAFPTGTHIGGVRTLRDLYDRCVIDKLTGCYRIRKANGKPFSESETPRVWFTPENCAPSAKRLAFRLAHPDKPLPQTWVVLDTCDTFDCIYSRHLKAEPRRDRIKALTIEGVYRSATKTIALREAGAKRSRVSPEVWQWAMESTQSTRVVGHAIGVLHTHVSQKRIKHRQAHMVMGVSA